MTLKEQLNDAMKAAMKARDDLRLSAVRMVRAAIKNREIDSRTELDDQAVTDVISTLAKQRRESIRLYRDGNRIELAEKEERELAVLLEFLPAQLTPDEIDAIVLRVILRDVFFHFKRDRGLVLFLADEMPFQPQTFAAEQIAHRIGRQSTVLQPAEDLVFLQIDRHRVGVGVVDAEGFQERSITACA